MGAPRGDACEMPFVEIARPPGDIGRLACEVDRVLAGAAASFQYVSRFRGQVSLQDRPYRLMVAMECRRVQSAIHLDRPPVPAKFDHVVRHQRRQSRARGNLHLFGVRCDNILALCRNGYTLHCLPSGFMLLEQRYYTSGNILVANSHLQPVSLLALALTIGVAAGPLRAQTGAAEGQKLAFDRGKGNCLTCHVIKGGDLAGTIGPPLEGIGAKYNRSDLVAILTDESLRNPQTLMPPFGRNRILTEQEINAIVDFLQTL